MGGSPMGGGGGKGTSSAPPPTPLPPVSDAGGAQERKRVQEAKRREAERLKRQAGATVATDVTGVLGSAQVGRKTLG